MFVVAIIEIKGIDFKFSLGRPCVMNEEGTDCAVKAGDCTLRDGRCEGRNDGSNMLYYEFTLWVSQFSVIDTIKLPAVRFLYA